ncbi:translation elongation factor Ts [Snodgrassella sp. CFCC 13594]|uniref:translation elongation factor Ts n=1 Tax=Snodgrassella sp. CFCC 13594 TaxID=1775559 RepID=UPI00082B182F|nr:translation elongation factor Ts [Snodgrassella sp. CFCC 13594]
MAAITAKMVGDLRAATGLGMMECKKALVEADGDFDKAEEILRIKSGAKAGKLAGRTAAEGVVTECVKGKVGAVVEINCETDFVAKDKSFLAFANAVAEAVVDSNPGTLEALAETKLASGETVEEARKAVIAKLGENITVRRFDRIETAHDLVTYMHGAKIGVLVEHKGGDAQAIRQVAMHIAASRPQCVSSAEVDPEVVAKERHIYEEQAAQSGKPANIIEKMVEGRVHKFLAEVTLLGQPFVINPDETVEKFLKENNAEIVRFVAFHVGEGIEKKEVDYAAEVAAASKV